VSGSTAISTTGGIAGDAVSVKDGTWRGWVESIEKKPAFLGFDKENGLMPIWDLAPTEARKNEILQAYRKKAAKELKTHILSFTCEQRAERPEARIMVPAGYKLVSGGARVNCSAPWRQQGAGNFLTASFPEGNNVWRASAKHHEVTDPATITVFAIAIYDPDDIWEVKVFSQTSARGRLIKQDAAVDAGYVMVGGGAKVDYGTQAGNLLYTSQPYDGKWLGQAKDQETVSTASISAYAVGLRPRSDKVPGIKVETKINKSPSHYSTIVTASVSVESGYVMVGGGASLGWENMTYNADQELRRGLELTGSYPTDRYTWEAQGKDQPRHGTQGFIDAYCIGVKVVDA
jgi:hypothetical protein